MSERALETPDSLDSLDALDLAFVVDTTGSMGSLLASAKQQMIAMMEALAGAAAVNLRLGVVEYRDHPPQDEMVYRVHGFEGDLSRAQSIINTLEANGGGDTPEAVLDGVLAACRELRWRAHARRIVVLVGDAPPHGAGAHGDGFAKGCPCGETIQSTTAACEEARVTLHAIGLTNGVTESFGALSYGTGGEFFATGQQGAAIERLRDILQAEFGHLEFDRRVLAAWGAEPHPSLDALAEQLASSRPAVSAALSRLGSRGVLAMPLRPAE